MANEMNGKLPLSSFLTFKLVFLAQLANRAGAHFHQRTSGLTLAEWRVLSSIGFFGPSSPSEVAQANMMDKAVISRVKSSLVGKGLVTDRADSRDSRKRLLDLTEDGRQIYVRTLPQAQERQAKILELLSEEERTAFYSISQKMQHYFEREVEM